MRASLRTLILVVASVRLVCGPAAAQELDGATGLAGYHRLIASYRAGKTSPVLEIMTWDRRRLLSVVDGIEGRGDPVRPWEASRFAAATWLHTDAALRSIDAGGRDDAMVQLDAASRVLRAGGERTTLIARQWYFAVVRDLRDRQWLATAERLLAFGRGRMPDDPVVLRESGMLAEFLSTDPFIPPARAGLDDGTASRRPAVPAEPFLALSERRNRYLEDAARWLRASFDADPSSVDVRLHLGRVASLLGAADGPLLLEGVGAAQEEYAYLATMFLGAAAERDGDLELAERWYRAAAERLPDAHAAYVALGRILRVTGRIDAARRALASSVSRPGTRREPWWWYFYEARGLSSARMAQRREEARR